MWMHAAACPVELAPQYPRAKLRPSPAQPPYHLNLCGAEHWNPSSLDEIRRRGEAAMHLHNPAWYGLEHGWSAHPLTTNGCVQTGLNSPRIIPKNTQKASNYELQANTFPPATAPTCLEHHSNLFMLLNPNSVASPSHPQQLVFYLESFTH